jgi:glutathione S-transferase
MSTPPCVVYGFSGSPFMWRVLIALDEKRIPHRREWIPRASGLHASPEMLARNPRGKLPVMLWGDVALYESLAICQFLELAQPEPPLVPHEPAARARTLTLAQEVESYAVPTLMAALDAALTRGPEGTITEQARSVNRSMLAELARWHRQLHASDSEYLVASGFSLADIALFPFVAFCVRCKLRMESMPELTAWYARVAARPSVQSSWPPHWQQTEGRDLGLNEV